ncbi:TlpA family protein disulfide reductase [Bradyrhizobium elkanii]|uniref:TlpA family protein disulfide reductase n=2 Tax=Bradyrhizobium elkanii TaxID=29448 RepID=UPI0035173D30
MISDQITTRRAFVARLAGAGAALAMPVISDSEAGEPPPFTTVRHQFIELRGARPLPPVPIPRLSGGVLDLTSLGGTVVLVNFWATWCPACRTELPMLDRLATIGRPDLAVIAIATDRDRSKVAPFVRELKLHRLTIGFDPGGLVTRADASGEADTPFALYSMPVSFLIGVTGQVEGYISGEADWLSVEASRLFDYYATASGK